MKNEKLALYILSGVIVVAFFALLYLLIVLTIPEENKDILNIVVGALIGAFTGVVSYHFGSSAGSKEKTAMMNTNATKTP